MNQAEERLRGWGAQTAIVLGSGLNSIVPEVGADHAVTYAEFSELLTPSVPGHEGRFVLGEVGGARVIFAQGRVHLYEGHTAAKITAGVRLLSRVGVKRIVLTNAAGSLNPKFAPGEWMILTDHINGTGRSPLLGGPNFVDMTEVYSARVREVFAKCAREQGVLLHEGVYVSVLGPQYETPAEVRMWQKLGADAVGMSTVSEAIQARARGMEVAGFSCLTNFGAGISKSSLSHEEVLETGKSAAEAFQRLLQAALPHL